MVETAFCLPKRSRKDLMFWCRVRLMAGLLGLSSIFLTLVPSMASAQNTEAPKRVAEASRSRTVDGKPNLNGIWQVMNTANWDLRAHAAGPSAIEAMGAAGAEPPGLGVVEGDEIPYQPWAAAKQKDNAANWLTMDPEVKCYLPGVPRATYMPYP